MCETFGICKASINSWLLLFEVYLPKDREGRKEPAPVWASNIRPNAILRGGFRHHSLTVDSAKLLTVLRYI